MVQYSKFIFEKALIKYIKYTAHKHGQAVREEVHVRDQGLRTRNGLFKFLVPNFTSELGVSMGDSRKYPYYTTDGF